MCLFCSQAPQLVSVAVHLAAAAILGGHGSRRPPITAGSQEQQRMPPAGSFAVPTDLCPPPRKGGANENGGMQKLPADCFVRALRVCCGSAPDAADATPGLSLSSLLCCRRWRRHPRWRSRRASARRTVSAQCSTMRVPPPLPGACESMMLGGMLRASSMPACETCDQVFAEAQLAHAMPLQTARGREQGAGVQPDLCFHPAQSPELSGQRGQRMRHRHLPRDARLRPGDHG